MREERIATLLGLSASNPEVGRTLDNYRIKRRPVPEADEGGDLLDTQDWLPNQALGIEFGFDDRASFIDEHPDEIGAHAMLLTQIYFYGDHDSVEPYQGPLPRGLALDDGRASARRKLAAFEATRRSYVRDTWELPRFRLTASYAKGGARLEFLLCALRRPELLADRDDAERLPGAERILEQLGRDLTDPELRLALAPLKVPGSLVDQGGTLIGAYRFRFGLDVRFQPRGAKDVTLSEVAFYAAHYGEAVAWPGTLPFGLTFGDSPERMVERMRRPPDHREDEDFHGSAAWRFPDFRIVVDYNSMENLLTRVQVFAGGGKPDPSASTVHFHGEACTLEAHGSGGAYVDDGADLPLVDFPRTGLLIGRLIGLDRDHRPLVRFETTRGEDIRLARSAASLHPSDIDSDVVLMFEGDDLEHPVVLGPLTRKPAAPQEPAEERLISADGDRVEIRAEREITLTCGKASITLTRSGTIILRGTYILSRSSGPNKIKGGSIQLN